MSRSTGSVTYSASTLRDKVSTCSARVAAVDVETACCTHGVVLLFE